MSKKLVFIIILILFVWGGALYLSKKSSGLLISPLILGKDQTEKISKKIVGLALDFSKSKELATLATVPRYLVYNADTGLVYYGKGTSLKTSPASFTKLLSAQVALDLIPLNTQIKVQERSLNKVPTILGLKAGEIFLAEDLLRGAIATSANDAIQALVDGAAEAVDIYYSEFIYYMNQKANLIGMNHSHFVNSDGLDEQNQYSTLEDIAILVNNVQKNYPEILTAAKSDNQDIATGSAHGFYYLPNWNGLLGVYHGVNGLKIAYTENAGYSTIVTGVRDKMSVVAIVSGTGSYLERDRAAADLLDAAFLTQGMQPIRVSTNMLNRRYKIWGDLARKIRAELSAIENSQ